MIDKTFGCKKKTVKNGKKWKNGKTIKKVKKTEKN